MKSLSLTLLICCSVALCAHHVAASRVARDFPFRSRLRKGGGEEGERHCSLVSKHYRSSKLEQSWLENAHRWSHDFCTHMDAFSKETQHWLDAIAAVERSNGSSTSSAAAGAAAVTDDHDVFSSFVSTYDCSGETVTKKTWIEPLSHGLRHPRALCGGGASLFDRGYLLLASQEDYARPPQARKKNKSGGVHDDGEVFWRRIDTASASARGDVDGNDASDADGVLSRETTASTRDGVFNASSIAAATATTTPTPKTKKKRDCAEPLHQNIFVDLGASTWDAGNGGPSQSWFYDSYKQRGIEFDRLLMWEANPTPAAAIFSDLPKDVWQKYQYFNWPASSNASDPSSPLNIIKKIAKPGDFVVLKLDIDTPEVEMAILRDLLSDPSLLELVDEFFFEYHVLFGPMTMDWFGSSDPRHTHTTDTLADSYNVFRTLREKRVRAHSWV